MQDFKNLKVWEKSHTFVLSVYRETVGFPSEEKFGITSQIRRASTSIPTNIAEGCGRGSNPELGRFLWISMGSASEVEYLLILSRDLGLISDSKYEELDSSLKEVKRKLKSLIQKVQETSN